MPDDPRDPPVDEALSSAAEQVTRADTAASHTLGTRAVRTASLQVASALSAQVIAFAGFVVIARLADPAVFGMYAAASILLGWTTLLTVAGMQAAVVQRDDRLEEAAATAFAVNVIGGFGLGLLAAAAGPLIGLFFHSDEVGLAAVALAGTVPIISLSIVPAALLQRRLAYRQALIGPLPALAYGVSAAVLLILGHGVWALVAATYVSVLMRTAAAWVLSSWRLDYRLISWTMYRELARYGRPVFIGEFLRETGRAGSSAVVGRMLGTALLAEFRYAQQLVNQSTLPIVLGAAHALLPTFSRIRSDRDRFSRALVRALRVLSLIVFPISLGFVALGEPLAVVLFGEAWRGAGPIMAALGGVGVALVVDSIASEAFKAAGRTELLPRMHALSATVPPLLLLAFADAGPTAIGLAVSAGALFVAAYAIVALSSVSAIPLRRLLGALIPAFGAAAGAAAVMLALERRVLNASQGGLRGLSLLCVEIAAGATVYVLSLRILAPTSWEELRAVMSSLRSGIRRRPASTNLGGSGR